MTADDVVADTWCQQSLKQEGIVVKQMSMEIKLLSPYINSTFLGSNLFYLHVCCRQLIHTCPIMFVVTITLSIDHYRVCPTILPGIP